MDNYPVGNTSKGIFNNYYNIEKMALGELVPVPEQEEQLSSPELAAAGDGEDVFSPDFSLGDTNAPVQRATSMFAQTLPARTIFERYHKLADDAMVKEMLNTEAQEFLAEGMKEEGMGYLTEHTADELQQSFYNERQKNWDKNKGDIMETIEVMKPKLGEPGEPQTPETGPVLQR